MIIGTGGLCVHVSMLLSWSLLCCIVLNYLVCVRRIKHDELLSASKGQGVDTRHLVRADMD